MAKNAFDKFINKEPKGAKKKEEIKQEKRKLKKEARSAGEELRRKKKEEKYGTRPAEGTSAKYEVRSTKLERGEKAPGKKFEARDKIRGRKHEPRNANYENGSGKTDVPRKKYEAGVEKKDAYSPARDEKREPKSPRTITPRKDAASFNKPTKEILFDKPAKTGYTANKRAVTKAKTKETDKKLLASKRQIVKTAKKEVEEWQPKEEEEMPEIVPVKSTLKIQPNKEPLTETAPIKRTLKRQPVKREEEAEMEMEIPRRERSLALANPETGNRKPVAQKAEGEQMPLNKYISHAGVCARREAALLVKQGKVTVNGSIIYEPGFKVTAADKVLVKDKQVYLQHNPVYILLNKPKDYLTTAKDPEGRKTVFDIVANATTERVFPVGRLDRNTTGVLLLTNDGELAQKLTHPSYEIKKIYEVKLDKDLTKKDFEAILEGITLEDGFVAADTLAYADAKDKSIIGIEIHSGRNRIVRRIFEHLGYDVKGLDRVMFANLTKKNVDRGKYRFLSEKEVRLLKFMNQSFLRKGKEKTEE